MAVAASAALGAGVVINPQISFACLVALLGAFALAAPASAWVLAALVAALSFKGLVSIGVLPSVATFIDLPLAWGAFFVALIKRPQTSPFLKRHLQWLGALALAVLIAWVFNPSEILRPLVYLMLLAEPFVIVGALMADPPSARMRRVLERTLLALLLIQIPFVVIEIAKYGAPSDHIQGTIYGAGAGAHVISAVVVVGGIWILSGGGGKALRTWRIPLVAALFFIPFIADAKQVIIALPAIVLASSWRVGPLQLVVRGALAIGSVVALFAFNPAGHAAAGFLERSQEGRGGKEAAMLFVWQKLEEDPASVAFGKGPAETVSRAAFMTTDLLQRSDSPLAELGLKPATIAVEAQQAALLVSGVAPRSTAACRAGWVFLEISGSSALWCT